MSLGLNITAGWLLVLGTLAMVGFWVPPFAEKLPTYLVFYFHFPSAINSMNLFYFAGVASLAYLFSQGGLRPGLRRALRLGGIASLVCFVLYGVVSRLPLDIARDGLAGIVRPAVQGCHRVRQLLAGELNLTAMEPGDKPWVVGLGLLLVAGGAVLTVWVASALASRRPKAKWDLWAAAAVEVGVLACTITLVTGGIWARGAWGEWRDWAFSDPRLVTVYIMWFTYVGYLVFRSTLEDLQRRERFSAVFAVIGMVNLPIVYLSIRVFAQVSHPMHLETTETSMTVTRWFGALAFLVLYVALWRSRHQVHVLRQATDRLQHEFGQAGV